MNTYKNLNPDDYYTALELAEILGLEKNTIIYRCKKGYYPGSIKKEPDRTSPQGMWLIPKSLIDTPTVVKDVATFTRQVAPGDLAKILENAVVQAVEQAVEPLYKTIDEQTAKIKELNDKFTLNSANIEKRDERLMEAIRLIQQNQKEQAGRPWWKKVFG